MPLRVISYDGASYKIAWLSDKTINLFQSDFKIVAKYFKAKRQKTKYTGSRELIRHVDATLKTLTALTGDNYFEEFYNENNLSEKGGLTMCEVVESIINRGIEKGLSKGRTEGQEEVIRKMLDAKALTAEQLSDILNIPVSKIKRIARKVPVQV